MGEGFGERHIDKEDREVDIVLSIKLHYMGGLHYGKSGIVLSIRIQ